MLVDCFTFAGEFDMLRLRLETLTPWVDRFVLVESGETFSGKPKTFYYLKRAKEFDHYPIVYLSLSRLRGDSAWDREAYQREAMIYGLRDLPTTMRVMIGDVDEIPRPEAIPEKIPVGQYGDMASFEQSMRVYDVRNVRVNKPWYGTVITSVESVIWFGPEGVRKRRVDVPHIANGGWHLTHMGGIEALRNKLAAFSHQELNTPEILAGLGRQRAALADPFGREDEVYSWNEHADRPRPLIERPEDFPAVWATP